MIMKRYLILMSALLSMISCHDSYEVTAPSLHIWTNKASYAVGDTIVFHIEGSPDMINLYPGTFGREYRYRDVDRTYTYTPTLSFRAAKFAGNNEDCAELLYTTEFNENYDFVNVQSVSWTNISDRFDIPSIDGTSANFSGAGTVDVTDIFEEGKTVYFAWYCKTNEASQRTRFQVADFNLQGVSTDDSRFSGILMSQAAMGFQWSLNAAAAAQESNLPNITSSLIYWNGIFDNTAGPLKEGYAVSGPITLPEQINLGKDSPIVVKGMQNENMTEYTYVFEEAGEFEVTFVGFNVNFEGKKEIVKTIKLTIEE